MNGSSMVCLQVLMGKDSKSSAESNYCKVSVMIWHQLDRILRCLECKEVWSSYKAPVTLLTCWKPKFVPIYPNIHSVPIFIPLYSNIHSNIPIYFQQFSFQYCWKLLDTRRRSPSQEGECDVVGLCRALCLQPDLPSRTPGGSPIFGIILGIVTGNLGEEVPIGSKGRYSMI